MRSPEAKKFTQRESGAARIAALFAALKDVRTRSPGWRAPRQLGLLED
jgi:hypothetical protein